ncbi:hypothetical protein GCM10017559_64070 [Streptosporangium longisporum]|uniref:Uncharacterized protein n=1 Tax=Streptosporangium longisporum TaxID=46187 RepID=A0ABP6L0J4_9ACTN
MLTTGALRCRVAGGADHHAGLGEARVALGLGDAEVGEDHPAALGDQHVAGLDVAVEHPLRVGRAQRPQQVGPDLGDQARRERTLLLDHLLQGARLDELHDDPGAAVLDDGVVDGGDRGVADAGGRTTLADHPFPKFGALRLAEPGLLTDLLDRHLTAEGTVVGPPHGAHRPPADWRDQLITVREHARLLFRHEKKIAIPP